MEVHLLGPLLVRTDQGTLVLASARERAVLTALALRAASVVTVDALQTALWGDEPPPSARKAIQTYVSSLRRALPPGSIATVPTGYVLELRPGAVDAPRFEDLARTGRALAAEARHAEALAAFTEALALWRGEPLQDLADHPDSEAEIRRLVELHRSVEEDRAEVRLDAGEHAAMVGELEAGVAAEPLRERRWGQLMLALYRSGRQADALRAYTRLRELLGEELGIEPSPELVALDRAIIDQSPELEPPVVTERSPAPEPPPRPAATAAQVLEATAPRQRHNLTTELTSFVGRRHELAELTALVRTQRLVTLTGPGGCGKTRLARAIAARRADGPGLPEGDDLPDGVWFVDLTPLPPETPGGADLIPGAVASVLAVDVLGDAEPAATVVAALAPRRLLLVLDNCEHVVAGAAAFVGRLLAGAPHLSVLATSREVLGVAGERAWPVPSLSLPEVEAGAGLPVEAAEASEAMQLFASRMPVPRPLADLSAGERTTMARIVSRLDGIPLAIELAAARTSVLSLDQVDERLDDRFRLLASGSRTARARHRTLAAAVEWSHDLLGPVEQAAFRRLAPFAGSFDLEAAEHVVAATGSDGVDIDIDIVLDLVDSLVAKSLVTVESAGPTVRYRLLETLRVFAAGRLAAAGDHGPRHDAHLDWYLTLAATAEPELEGPSAPRWLGRLEAELDNLRAALAWSAGGRAAEGLELALALRTFWDVRGHLAEGLRWLDRLVAAAGDAPVERRARGVLFAGELAARQNDLAGAAQRYERAAQAAADHDLPWVAGRELHDRAALAGLRGDHGEARGLLDRCLAIARTLDDDRLLARAYGNLGWIAVQQGDEAAAGPALDESLRRFRGLGDRQGVAWLLQYRGDLARRQGDLDRARSLIEESFDLRIELADTYGLSSTLESLAACLDLQEDQTGAAVLRDERLKLLHELGHRHPGGVARRTIALTDRGEERWRSSTVATTTS